MAGAVQTVSRGDDPRRIPVRDPATIDLSCHRAGSLVQRLQRLNTVIGHRTGYFPVLPRSNFIVLEARQRRRDGNGISVITLIVHCEGRGLQILRQYISHNLVGRT